MKTPPLIPTWLLILTTAFIIGAVMVSAGCASVPMDVQAHEERHCEGWTHTGTAPFYVWAKTRDASPQPWFYVRVADVDRTCREAGAQADTGHSINGCATWKPDHCIIYLQTINH